MPCFGRGMPEAATGRRKEHRSTLTAPRPSDHVLQAELPACDQQPRRRRRYRGRRRSSWQRGCGAFSAHAAIRRWRPTWSQAVADCAAVHARVERLSGVCQPRQQPPSRGPPRCAAGGGPRPECHAGSRRTQTSGTPLAGAGRPAEPGRVPPCTARPSCGSPWVLAEARRTCRQGYELLCTCERTVHVACEEIQCGCTKNCPTSIALCERIYCENIYVAGATVGKSPTASQGMSRSQHASTTTSRPSSDIGRMKALTRQRRWTHRRRRRRRRGRRHWEQHGCGCGRLSSHWRRRTRWCSPVGA